MNVRIKEDNQAIIKIVRSGYSQRLAHMQRSQRVNLGSMHEAITDHGAGLDYVETDKQAADIFTKDLAPCKWDHAVKMLGVQIEGDEEPFFMRTTPAADGEHVCGGVNAGVLPTPTLLPSHHADNADAGPQVRDTDTGVDLEDHLPKAGRCRGYDAANLIIDDSIDEANRQNKAHDVEPGGLNAFRCGLADEAYNAFASHVNAPTTRARPSGKLPGWGLLIEVWTDDNSNLGIASHEYDGVRLMRIMRDIDWSDPETVDQTCAQAESMPGCSTHASLPCTAWSSWHEMAIHKYGAEYVEKLAGYSMNLLRLLRDMTSTWLQYTAARWACRTTQASRY